MPGLTFNLRRARLGGAPLALLRARGFADATSTRSFRLVLDKLLGDGTRYLLVDCQELAYINSSAILSLLQARENLHQRGGELLLVRLPRPIGYTMHQLGLTKVVPVFPTEREGLDFLRTGRGQGMEFASYLKRRRGLAARAAARFFIPLLKPAARLAPSSSVLMIVPRESHFTSLMKTRLFNPQGKLFIVFSCLDALRSFRVMSPDLIILEDSMRYSEEFLAKVKIEQGHSMISVLKLYQSESDLDRRRDFKIWENDYLIEPFEMMELFTLAEAELRRVPHSRQHLLQQVRFEFRSRPAQVAQALGLVQSLLRQSGLPPPETAGLTDAVREALDNAVLHGNKRRGQASVQVIFVVDRERVVFTVEDEGEGFDHAAALQRLAREDPQRLAARQRSRAKGGGLGLLMMQRLCDKLEFAAGGRIVRLEKRLPRPQSPEKRRAAAGR